MRTVQWYTNEWDSVGEEVCGIESEYITTNMSDAEIAKWAMQQAKEEIQKDGGEILYTVDNEIMYKDSDGTFYAYVWVDIDGDCWDLMEGEEDEGR